MALQHKTKTSLGYEVGDEMLVNATMSPATEQNENEYDTLMTYVSARGKAFEDYVT